ncbi:uncharacterized protein KY384_007187 [Bacidia gigantensis]|uniref:uncharacterized protein n=1 Tax=Bacidia gigantensis TaxID=2732470 RepID=UPI001D039C0F|nr:uncharacterized protein KY384_007187 [Bacidia gigantensis]KAG8528270.1 hypothetical protein KY384_007187 [Bacidia gigantensis]
MEIVGYTYCYISNHKDRYNKIYFIVQYFFIVTAPVLISASIYVCLTKLIRWSVHDTAGAFQISGLQPRPILWLFISADVVTTIIQMTGAALIGNKTSKHEDPTTANNILLAGLAVQTFCFVIFLLLFALFTHGVINSKLEVYRKRPFIIALAVASALVCLRTIFRLVETSQGVFSYLSTHEVFFGSLEFMPIVLAIAFLAIWHPARWVRDEQ